MVSSDNSKIQNFKNAIINKIGSLVSTHNSDSSAHSTEMAKKLNISQTSNKGKNVVVDSSTGNITFENKYSHPATHPASMITGLAAAAESGSAEDIYDYGEFTSFNLQSMNVSQHDLNALIDSSLMGKSDTGHAHEEYLTSHQSLAPVQVYNCTSWNTTYTDSSATKQLTLYKLGPIYFLKYFMTTKTLTYASTSYNMNNDSIPSEYRPGSDRTFNIATSSSHTAKLTITSGGKIQISADTNSLAISFSGSVIWWW